jgi:uncharacterized membrane protein YbhN (UPF0104 family)
MAFIKLTPKIKQALGWLVLIVTVGLFAYYLKTHPNFWQDIKNISLGIIALLLVLYSGILLTNGFILYWSVQICSKIISKSEATMLNAYSTLVNFFGPLQSGPGFRAIYLKKKHNVGVKAYGVATLLYYGSFGALSLILLGYGISPLLSAAGLVVFVGMGLFGTNIIAKWKPQLAHHNPLIRKIIFITLLQVFINTLIYFTELLVVDSSINYRQAIIYTGAANLALFVSLTPGAIGFREAFLLFSQNLHGIDTNTILSASVIDRTVYFVFLGLIFLVTAVFQAKDKFKNIESA